ncbi:MAG: signal transduction protein [bacterium]|nr:signal transduction protein [bacterium]
MKTGILSLLIGALVVVGAPAIGEEKPEGRRLAELTFEMVDEQGKGSVNLGDVEAYRDLVFVSMDADDDGKITLDEFLAWDIGFEQIAEGTDKVVAHDTALKVVFAFWDRNGDGSISKSEHQRAIAADFQRADLNDDAVLTEDEFLGGFAILVAIRAALKPE